jgi:hypothetical protein
MASLVHGQAIPTGLEYANFDKKGGHNEKVEPSSCNFGAVNRCLHSLVRSSRTTCAFAVAKSLSGSADRLH